MITIPKLSQSALHKHYCDGQPFYAEYNGGEIHLRRLRPPWTRERCFVVSGENTLATVVLMSELNSTPFGFRTWTDDAADVDV